MRGIIINAGDKADCFPILYCIRVALTRKGGDIHISPLVMSVPTSNLVDEDLILHLCNVLVHHIPCRDPSLQHAQRSLIKSHIGEATVELCNNRKENSTTHAQMDNRR